MSTKTILLVLATLLQLCIGAPVRLVAFNFIRKSHHLPNHPIQRMETGEVFNTTSDGYLEIDIPVGQNVTFTSLDYNGFHATQTATVQVPDEGLNTLSTMMVLQVPSNWIYDLLEWLVPGKKKTTGFCQFVVTATDVDVTWADFPQGLEGTVATLDPPLSTNSYYFGTFGWFSNKTNPLPNDLTSCSWDGGVLFENVPIRDEPYVVTAEREGYTFSETIMYCHNEGLVNAAPNQGPKASLNNPY